MVRDLLPEINLDGRQDDLGEEPNPRAKKFYEMCAKVQQPIWPGNPTTLLEWATKIAGKKTANRDSASSADGTVEVALMSAHPDYIYTLPQDWRSVKKFMLNLGLSFRTYDFCINHCFLYYKDGLHLDKCPTCGESRYEARRGKGKRVPQRKMWFFPLTERLQRLYMSRKTAEHMTWHVKCKRRSDPVIHPAGSEQWAHFDEIFPDFASEICNVRLGLCTDGFDPHHGTTTSPHSIWPVFITPYNLPPDLCMRPEFIFMTALIQGPEDPSIHIDVMLRPIVDELKDLWHHGAVTYDSFRKQNFTMRASLFCTINDFPGYAMLSGWSTKGKLGCPCCMQNTDAFYLKNTRKVCWFDEHRKFLPPNHPERRNQNDYIRGRVVRDMYPERMDIRDVVRQVASLPEVTFGKCTTIANKYKPPEGKGKYHNWSKRSIFWELIYWPVLFVRHNLDVMHTEKNCFEQVHVTTFDLGKNSKDNLQSRQDLRDWTNRSELFIDENDNTSHQYFIYNIN
ncbi:hypothetical protein OROMI_021058 [Orobanche minor]